MNFRKVVSNLKNWFWIDENAKVQVRLWPFWTLTGFGTIFGSLGILEGLSGKLRNAKIDENREKFARR